VPQKKDDDNRRRLQKVQRESILSALSSGKFNKKKVEKTRHDQ